MPGLLTPPRMRGVEILDDAGVAPELMRRSMLDVERANLVFGGTRAALAELESVLHATSGTITLLDVGTGTSDIPQHARQLAKRHGVGLRAFGLDRSATLLHASGQRLDGAVRGDALRLPFRSRSVNVVLCSQLLHHFDHEDAVQLVREMDRVARDLVVISDLRRSWLAAAGLWIASFLLRFHPVSRHDGVVSVLRGFRPEELESIVAQATGRRTRAKRRLGFRITASWKPIQ